MSASPSSGIETPGTAPKPAVAQSRKLRNYRLLMVIPFIVSALILAPLAMLKKTSEVELELQTTRFSFVNGQSDGAAPFFGTLPLVSLQLSNFEELALRTDELSVDDSPFQDELFPGNWEPLAVGAETRIIPTSTFATLTLHEAALNELIIPPQARVALSWAEDDPQTLTVSVLGGRLRGSVKAEGELLLTCDYCQIEGVEDSYDFVRIRTSTKRARVMRFSGNENSIAALEAPPGSRLVANDLPVEEGLDFTRLVGANVESTIIGEGGKILYPEVAREVPIEPRDFVDVEMVGRSFIRALELDGGLKVSLHGVAEKVQTGPKGFAEDPSPSYLEWIYAQETWFVYFNAVVVIATTLVGLMKRMKVLKEG